MIMNKLYKLPKLESNKDTRFEWSIVLILVGIVLVIISLVTLGRSYQNAMNNCLEMGYDRAYCEMMLR